MGARRAPSGGLGGARGGRVGRRRRGRVLAAGSLRGCIGRRGGRCVLASGFGGRRRRRGLATTPTAEIPLSIDDTNRLWRKEAEECTREIEAAVRAPRALVHDCGLSSLSVVGHRNSFEAVGAWVTSSILRRIQCHDEVTLDVVLATSTKADIVEGPACAREAFVQLDLARLALCDLLVAGVIGITMGRCAKSGERKSKSQEGTEEHVVSL